MLMLDNLIRLYYLNKGSFEGIENTNFMSGRKLDETELYEILGYQGTVSDLSAKEVYEGRKDFVLNSYNPSYKKAMMKRFNAVNNSDLVDILVSKGFLGLERKHISTLGDYKNCGVPSKFINQKISYALALLESRLNTLSYRGKRLLDYKKELLLQPIQGVREFISRINIDLDLLFKVKYYDQNSAIISDGVLYISDVEGYTEKEVQRILFNCYLLGLPKLPLYLRSTFMDCFQEAVSLFDLDAVHTLIDIANISKCSVKELLNSFGFNLPDAENMFSQCYGYYTFFRNKIWYTNPRSEMFYDFTLNEFVEALANNSIQSFDIERSLAIRDSGMASSNVFSR